MANMGSVFLGVGWSFPVALDGAGNIAIAAYEESVRQSIWLILGTAKGERAMRPGFGCGIHELVFATAGPAAAGALAHEVRQSLNQWEPRIDLLDIQVNIGGSGDTMLIQIQYRVRATNTVSNLVYPFYLQGGAA
jgi:phage baseplate assembly protein W